MSLMSSQESKIDRETFGFTSTLNPWPGISIVFKSGATNLENQSGAFRPTLYLLVENCKLIHQSYLSNKYHVLSLYPEFQDRF